MRDESTTSYTEHLRLESNDIPTHTSQMGIFFSIKNDFQMMNKKIRCSFCSRCSLIVLHYLHVVDRLERHVTFTSVGVP